MSQSSVASYRTLCCDSVIALAHDSAGPQGDIVVPYEGKTTGFLANTAEQYADALCGIVSLPEHERLELQVCIPIAIVPE